MNIRRWHWGKMAILWTWGGVIVGLLLTDFLSRPVGDAPGVSVLTFVGSLSILIALTVLTWIWLGGKEDRSS